MSRLASCALVTAAAWLAGGAAQASPRLWSVEAEPGGVYARVALDPKLEPPEPSDVSLIALDRNQRIPARAVRRLADSGRELRLAVVSFGRARDTLAAVKRALAEIDATRSRSRVVEYAAPLDWDCTNERPAGPDYRATSQLASALNMATLVADEPGRRVLFMITDGSSPSTPQALRAELDRARELGFELALLALPPPDGASEARLAVLAHSALTQRSASPADAPAAARALVRRLNATYEIELPYDARLGLDGREHDFALRVYGDETNPVSATLPSMTPAAPASLARVAEDVTLGVLGLIPPVTVLLLIAWAARARARVAHGAPLAAEVLPPRRSTAAAALHAAASVALIAALADVVWLATHAASRAAHLTILGVAGAFWLFRRRAQR
jgi:hypothetical protein